MKLKRYKSYEDDLRSPMRGLIQRLSLGPQARQAKIIAFISARSREGTSTIATSYAKALAAETSQKILLIDAGPGKVKRFQAMDMDPSIGIVDTLITGPLPKDSVYPVGESVAIGRWVAHDENRGAAARMTHDPAFWQSLLGSFDSLIIDAPPLQKGFDGVMLAAKAHSTVIVVEAEKTPAPAVKHLQDTLTGAGANIAGIVMNKRRYYIPKRVYRKL